MTGVGGTQRVGARHRQGTVLHRGTEWDTDTGTQNHRTTTSSTPSYNMHTYAYGDFYMEDTDTESTDSERDCEGEDSDTMLARELIRVPVLVLPDSRIFGP